MKEPYAINPTTGECTLTKMSKEPDKEPNAKGSWGIGSYSTMGNGDADGYGFYRPENPNNFWPDYESCTEWEIANHKLACELYDGEHHKSVEVGENHGVEDYPANDR